MSFLQHIEIDAQKRFGRPVVRGTRISVADVLNWLGNGMSKEEIINDYPELSEEKINSCLKYAADRQSHLGIAS